MLKRFVLHPPNAEGFMVIGPETEDTPCTYCGGESVPNWCPGDGRSHHHGGVHTVNDGLEPVCKTCWANKVVKEWIAAGRGYISRPEAQTERERLIV